MVWLVVVGVLVLMLMDYGDVEKRLEKEDCAVATQVVSDMRRRVRALRDALEDDVVMYGRYPKRWYEPRLISRTHQPLMRDARDMAARNLERLLRRMTEAGCATGL